MNVLHVLSLHCCLQGEKLKESFLKSGKSFQAVEMQVKKWHEKKKAEETVVKPVTKKMLEKQYFWDESCPQ